MLPDDALDRLIEGSKKVADLCRQNKVQQWEIIATQSYGHQLDIEAGKISLAAGGGDGGYGIRVVEDGKFGYAYLVDVKSAEKAIQQEEKDEQDGGAVDQNPDHARIEVVDNRESRPG